MSRWVPFLVVASLIVGSTHLYACVSFLRAFALRGRARIAAIAGFVFLFVLLMSALPLSRALPRSIATPVAIAAFVWMATLFLTVLLLALADLVRLAARPVTVDPARRELLRRAPSMAAFGIAWLLAAEGVREARRPIRVRRLPVAIRRLPPELDGFTIAQITDLHLGLALGNRWLADLVAEVDALAPDVVAITGDLADGSVADLAGDVAPLADLRAREGVFFVTGNHEYFFGADDWMAHLATLGVRVLRNERVALGGGRLDLAGVEDFSASRYPGHGADLAKALAGRDDARPVVLLAHQPRQVIEAAEHGVDLVLSGHTHGGQLWPWRWFVLLQQPYVAGLHRHRDTSTQIWVSNGTGYWGPPMRLGVPAEITLLTLRPA